MYLFFSIYSTRSHLIQFYTLVLVFFPRISKPTPYKYKDTLTDFRFIFVLLCFFGYLILVLYFLRYSLVLIALIWEYAKCEYMPTTKCKIIIAAMSTSRNLFMLIYVVFIQTTFPIRSLYSDFFCK